MKMARRAVSFVLCLLLCFYWFSIDATAEELKQVTQFQEAPSATGNGVAAKLAEVLQKYPSGSYWTDTFDGAKQCYGFAGLVVYNVFGKSTVSGKTYRWWNYAGESTSGMVNLGSVATCTEANVKELLGNARPGDVLQFDKGTNGHQHSMIIYSLTDTGAQIYECNWYGSSGSCKVTLTSLTYKEIANRQTRSDGSKRGKLSLLTSDNWDEINGPSIGSTLSLTGQVFPSGHYDSLPNFGLRGIFSSNYTITSVVANVTDSGNNFVMHYDKPWNSTQYDIQNDGLNEAFSFGKLTDGAYCFSIAAMDSSGKRVEAQTSFDIGTAVNPDNQCGDNLTWALLGDGALVISGNGSMWDYSDENKSPWRESGIEVKTVQINEGATTIGDSAFSELGSLTTATLPSTLQTIGYYAFSDCTALKKCDLPANIATVNSYAFVRCTSLQSISIPASLTFIGSGAFEACDSITQFAVDENNPYYFEWDGVLFEERIDIYSSQPAYILHTYPSGRSGSYKVLAPINEIAPSAFASCNKLTEVSIPDTMLTIGNYAFYHAYSLGSIRFEGSAPEIGEGIFGDITATAYYPKNDNTWTEAVRDSYWGNITWIPYSSGGSNDIPIDEAHFPDANFRIYVQLFDTNSDGALSEAERAAVEEIDCSSISISSLQGVEFFTKLKSLSCSDNALTVLDVSKNTALTELYCSGNQLTALDVSKNTALTKLNCWGNQLKALDVSKNTALIEFSCGYNHLKVLDVSKNTAMVDLNCPYNQLTALDISRNTALEVLYCFDNQLTALDTSKNSALEYLYCYNNPLAMLDVSQNTALKVLYCYNNQLAALDVSRNTALGELWCHYNQLTALDVSKNTTLTELWCFGNPISTLDLQACPVLLEAAATEPITLEDYGEDALFYGAYQPYEGNPNIVSYRLGVDRSTRLITEGGEPIATPGDANGDGKVNGKDAILLAQFLAGWEVTVDTDTMDVNKDGKVNGKDAIMLAQFLAGWDVVLK